MGDDEADVVDNSQVLETTATLEELQDAGCASHSPTRVQAHVGVALLGQTSVCVAGHFDVSP